VSETGTLEFVVGPLFYCSVMVKEADKLWWCKKCAMCCVYVISIPTYGEVKKI